MKPQADSRNKTSDIVVLLFLAKAGLPVALRWLANRALRKIPNYHAKIRKLSISFVSPRLTAHDLYLRSVNNKTATQTLKVSEVTFGSHWKNILTGRLVAYLRVKSPVLLVDLMVRSTNVRRLTKGEIESKSIRVKTIPVSSGEARQLSWQGRVRQLPSFKINYVAVVDGKVRLRGLSGPTGENIEVRQINIRLVNLTNSPQEGSGSLARAACGANVMSGGKLVCNAAGFPLATSPTFNLDFQTRNIDLPELRSLIEKTTNVTIERGTLDLYAEAAASDGNIRGYIKPVFDHLELGESRDRSVVGKIKNGLARMVLRLIKNRRRDRIATRLDFDGPVEDPQGRLLGAVGGLFRNAFIAAERASFDYRFWLLRSRSADEIQIGSQSRSFSKARAIFGLLKKTFGEWSNDGAPRMAAALSYYTAFSMAPLLILAIAVAGVVLGPEAAQGKIVAQIGGLVGTQSADAIQSMIKAANRPSEGIFATIVGIVSLIGGATGVLSELKSALNRIWRTEESSDVKEFVKKNILFLGMVLGMGFLLTVSLIVSAAISGLGKYLGGLLPASEFLLHMIDFVFSLGFIAALFAAMYKFLPNAEVAWRDVWIGAVVTSFLFAIGKLGLGIYIGKSAVASSYGAAGAVLIILLWVYYSGLIFYFGAEFTRVYADLWGSRKHTAVSPMRVR